MGELQITDAHLGKMKTIGGTEIDFLNPTVESIHIKDIATALSNICRFGGHTKPFYSVAQHSVLVASMVDDAYKKYALLHDAPEAYLGDVIKPLKILLGDVYKELEDKFEDVILKRFDVSGSQLSMHFTKEETKIADIAMLKMENQAVKHFNPGRLAGYIDDNNWDVFGWAWSPADAEQLFLATFEKLFGPEMMH